MTAQIDEFIAGRPLVELQALNSLAMKLRFIPCNELSVERLHRMASLQLARAPHSGGQAVSLFSGRRDEIVRHVLGSPDDPTNLPSICTPETFLQLFDEARNAGLMVNSLQLQKHVVW